MAGIRDSGFGIREKRQAPSSAAFRSSESRIPNPESRLFYGGTFDPVHNGHLAIARAARELLGCPVRLMPAADPPHRAPPGASAAQRAAMLGLAIAEEPGMCVDRRELERDGPSYSIDTLHAIRAEAGMRVPVALLVGADSLVGLPTWHRWRELFALSHFVVAERAGNPVDERLPGELAETLRARWSDDPQDLRAPPAGRVLRLRQPLRAESATAVRALIAEGGNWEALVPAAVARFIRERRLYGVDERGAAPASL